MPDIVISVKTDAQRAARDINDLETAGVRAGRSLRTVFENVGQYFDRTSRYAESLGKRLTFIREEADRSAAALRRLQVEQRGGGRNAAGGGAPGGGIAGGIGQGVSAYTSGAIGGGVAGATTAAIGFGLGFIQDSVKAGIEGSQAQVALDNASAKTNVSLRDQARLVDDLRAKYQLSRAEATKDLALSTRIAGNLGQGAKGGVYTQSVLNLLAQAGISRDRAPDTLASLASGEEEGYKRLFGLTPSQIAQRQTGRTTFAPGEVQRIAFDYVNDQGQTPEAVRANARYGSSVAGRANQLSAIYSDIKQGTGDSFVNAAPYSLGVSTFALPFASSIAAIQDGSRKLGLQGSGNFKLPGLPSLRDLALVGPAAFGFSAYRGGENAALGVLNGGKSQGDVGVLVSAAREAGSLFFGFIQKGADYLLAKSRESARDYASRVTGYNQEAGERNRYASLAVGDSPLAQLDERYRQGRDTVITQGNAAFNAVDERYHKLVEKRGYGLTQREQRDRDAEQLETQRTTANRISYIDRTQDLERSRVVRDTNAGLDARIGGLESRNAGRTDPVNAAIISARAETAALRAELEKIKNDPEFAARSTRLVAAQTESQRQTFAGLAVSGLQQTFNLQERLAGFDSRYVQTGVKVNPYTGLRTDEAAYSKVYGPDLAAKADGFKLGLYGQKTDETNYTYAPSQEKRAERVFAAAEENARKLGGTGEDVSRYAREFRLGALGNDDPGGFNDSQRSQLQADILAELKDQNQRNTEALSAAKRTANATEALYNLIKGSKPAPDEGGSPVQPLTINLVNGTGGTADIVPGGSAPVVSPYGHGPAGPLGVGHAGGFRERD